MSGCITLLQCVCVCAQRLSAGVIYRQSVLPVTVVQLAAG